MRIKHCMGNALHLHVLLLSHNLHTLPCSHRHNTLHPNLWALTHYQFCHESHQLVFLSPLLPWPSLLKIQKLLPPCHFPEKEKTWKPALLVLLPQCAQPLSASRPLLTVAHSDHDTPGTRSNPCMLLYSLLGCLTSVFRSPSAPIF